MKNILLTGASGFIGSCILKKILKLNYSVYAIGNTKVKFRHKNFKFIKQNLKKKIVLNKRVNFDYIIHTAAISPAKYVSTNICVSLGRIFAITEITPCPPMASSGRMAPSSPEYTLKS